MDTRQIEYILTIAEEHNLSRAAERLFLSQSALSQQLAKLEDEGLPPLFYRSKGEMMLTDAGKIYVNGARIILKISQDTIDTLKNLDNNQTQVLRIAISDCLLPTYYTRVLPWIKHTYPNVEVQTSIATVEQTLHAMESDDIDLAVFFTLRNSSDIFDFIPLYRDELVLASAPHLAGVALPVALPQAGSHLRNLCDHAFTITGFSRSIYAELDDTNTRLELAKLGECASVLPKTCLSGTGLLAESFDPPFYFYTVVACRKGSHSPLFTQLVQRLQAIFKET